MSILKDRFEGTPDFGQAGSRRRDHGAAPPLAGRPAADRRTHARAGTEEAQDLAARRGPQRGRQHGAARRPWALPLTW